MKKTTLILVVAILGLYSCDKRTTFEKSITNSSGYDIVIYGVDNNQGMPPYVDSMPYVDSLVIANNSTEIIYFESHFSKVESYSGCDLTYNNSAIDSVKIVAPTDKNLAFDINMPNKWIFNIESKDITGHGKCNCELEILDGDIE